MLHSIRFRLLLTVGLVVVAALAAVALVTSRVTRQEFGQFVAFRFAGTDSTAEREAGSKLEEYFKTHRTWEGTRSLLSDLTVRSPQVRGFIIVDRSGKVACSSAPDLVPGCLPTGREREIVVAGAEAGASGPRVVLRTCDSLFFPPGGDSLRAGVDGGAGLRRLPRLRILLGDSGQTIGRLITVVDSIPPDRGERLFLRSVNRWLVAAVLVAGLLALGSTFLLSRRILHPVEELTSIARQMGKGDLSRRASVKAKDEIGELARTFNGMADGLARIERLRRNMVEDVAHELRTPLTNIRCQIEAVQDGLLTPERAVIDSLHQEVMALSVLLDNLQELALAEAGQLRLAPQPLSLAPEIERVVRALKTARAGEAAEIVLSLPTDLPPVLADPERFRQILRNLLGNALTFTPPSGCITVAARRADPPPGETSPGPSMVEISVADTGRGIAPDELPFIFERFYRADPSRQRATGGAGLGLAIVKQLVEAHCGRIRAESTLHVGTRILFTLPVGPALPRRNARNQTLESK